MRQLVLTSCIGLALTATACQPEPVAPSPLPKVSQEDLKNAAALPNPAKPGEKHSSQASPKLAAVTEATKIGETRKTLSGLSYTTLAEGSGAIAQQGDKANVHLTGTLENGTTFQNTRKEGKPLSFVVGSEEVVLGLDEGVLGMRVGERRKLTVPSRLGYGALGTYSEDQKGKPLVPPNATLTYEVELVEVTPKSP